ncbi:MAG TPA: TatD family hydrolase [Candidatus Paceibacterota bacterium]|nr:TatD family hydrolase [Candidatus Paceibacterota bacterium]
MDKIKYIDNHAHLNFAIFDEDRADVLARMDENEVSAINIGTKQETSRKAVELSKTHKNLWSIVGLHPIHTDANFHDSDEIGSETAPFASKGEVFDKEFYGELAKDPKCLGIGECGFDFYRVSPETYSIQEKAFRAQIELALELDKPLMLHMRSGNGMNAYQETLKILKEYGATKGEAHFFAGSVEDAKAFLEQGFYISFTGVITFAEQYKELIEAVPIERLLSETDSPYVAPVPYRGKRCEPTYVIEVVKKIAEIKGLSLEETTNKLLQNSMKLWNYQK